MNEMKLFNNSQFGTLEVVLINGKEYFPATDCATMLGYTNPRKAVLDHCREDGVTIRDGVSETTNQYGVTTKQTVQKKYITEGNLYRLISHSKLPAAEKFEKWIFDEVIPSIRATGGYGIQTISDNEQIAKIVTMAVTETIKQLMPLLSENAVKSISVNLPDEAKPASKIQFSDVTVTTKKIESFPKELRDEVNKILLDMREKQNVNFSAVARFCTANGYKISFMGVKRYYHRLFD